MDLRPFQLKFRASPEMVSIALVKFNETVNLEAAIAIDCDTVRLLKINFFDDLDTCFIFENPLELYTNILSLMLLAVLLQELLLLPLKLFLLLSAKK